MSFVPKERELEAVVKLHGPQRYSYTIQKIVGWQEVWSVRDDQGWVLFSSDAGEQLMPIWPASAYASLSCNGEWSRCHPDVISLDDFAMKWLPGMNRDRRKVVVFPLSSAVGVIAHPDQVFQDIRDARSQYDE